MAALVGFLLGSSLGGAGPRPPARDTPPFFRDPPRVACGSQVIAFPLNRLEFSVEAADFDIGDVVTLRADELPPGATSGASRPSGNPVDATVTWTPRPADGGTSHPADFTAVDGAGATAACRVDIEVQPNDYAALGDSYSAGEGVPADRGEPPDFIGGGECHRSIHAYSEVFQASERFQYFTFVACSGAKMPNVRDGQHLEPAQLDTLRPMTTLVTLTIGGNDIGFVDIVKRCLNIKGCISHYAPGTPDDLNTKIDGQRDNLIELYEMIRDRAPHAVILVVGYPRIFAPGWRGRCGLAASLLTSRRRKWLNREGERLNDVIRGAVDAADSAKVDDPPIRFVDVQDLFQGQEACTDRELVNGVSLPVVYSFHPNRAGQTKLALAVQSVFDRLASSGP